MTDLLTAVRTVRKDAHYPPERQTENQNVEDINEAAPAKADNDNSGDVSPAIVTAEQALDVLRGQSDADAQLLVLNRLQAVDGFGGGFNIHAPGALQARFVNTLVETTIPTFWVAFGRSARADLLSCLRNLTGISAIIASLRRLLQQASERSATRIGELLSVLQLLLDGDQSLYGIWANVSRATPDQVKNRLAQKEFASLVASGKIVAVVAQAEDSIKSNRASVNPTWLADGAQYAQWLGRNIANSGKQLRNSDDCSTLQTPATELLAKAMNLGYNAQLIKSLVTTTLKDASDTDGAGLRELPHHLPPVVKRQFLENVLLWISTMSHEDSLPPPRARHTEEVASFAAFLQALLTDDEPMEAELFHILTDPVRLGTLSFAIRRACIAFLSMAHTDGLDSFLENMLSIFGDRSFINHSPNLQQEGLAQQILITAGHVHRKSPMALVLVARSSGHMRGVSNRLDTSNARARWLGMIVATALSSLTDKEGSKMNFGTDEMQSNEAKSYLEIVHLQDAIGQLKDFISLLDSPERDSNHRRRAKRHVRTEILPILNGKQTFGPPRPPEMLQTEVQGERVTEIIDGESDEDDDLKPYAKPDSDPEDSDEDATLVNRKRPRPPVYVRDLMRMLQDDKDHDRFQMGIKNAATLIRRKADFGNEVKDHAEELAVMLCGMQDPFDTDDFDELRLQALIAVFLSHPQVLAPWLSGQAFSGDYSIAQRCVILSALGLGGRELAGFANEDELNPKLLKDSMSFPSKRLTGRLLAVYSPGVNAVKRLEAASNRIEQQIMKPLALSAADKSTAHLDAVKIRTFSSRVSNEQRTMRKPAPNQLARVLGEALFFPLIGRYQQDVAAYGSASLFASVPFLLVTFLKTLALLLHASGPATYTLGDITVSFWDLLLSLRVQAVQDIAVMEAVLFSLLTLLEVNGGRQQSLAQENPKHILETKEWVEIVFERLGGGDLITEGSDEEVRVRSLAAGVLVKVGEVVHGYQQLLIGL